MHFTTLHIVDRISSEATRFSLAYVPFEYNLLISQSSEGEKATARLNSTQNIGKKSFHKRLIMKLLEVNSICFFI